MDLHQQSIEIIIRNQHASGAYIASPNFPTYAYSWFRDGSFIAYAMNRVQQHQSARRFHLWCARVIEGQAEKIETLVLRKLNGENISPQECLPTRYLLEGSPAGDDWTDFQLDGYGAWLWSVSETLHLTEDASLLRMVTPAINLILQYLLAFWDSPCYDCWEEHLEAVHPYTLAAILAGIEAINHLQIPEIDLPLTETAFKIKSQLNENAIHPNGYVRKLYYPKGGKGAANLTNLVDASLIGLVVPYNNRAIDEQVLQSTMDKIEAELYTAGGYVYRYLEDTYYGGGEWIVLAGWLGWYWCRRGQYAKAKRMKALIEATAGPDGRLPEQVSDHMLNPSYYAQWVSRWGEIANPLLWSHAMYLILCERTFTE